MVSKFKGNVIHSLAKYKYKLSKITDKSSKIIHSKIVYTE